MFRCALFLIVIGLFSGCQSMTTQTMTPLADQKQIYVDGLVAVASKKEASIAMIAATSNEIPNGQRIQLALQVQNLGENNIDIDTSNIRVTSPEINEVKVYSYAELVKEEKQQRAAALIVTAIAGAANVYNASVNSNVSTTGTYNSSTFTPGGTYRTTGTYNSTTYDPLRAQIASNMAANQASNQMNNIANNSDNRLNTLKGSILKRTTVFPGSAHNGMFVFEAPRLKKDETRKYNVLVSFGGEQHVFVLLHSM